MGLVSARVGDDGAPELPEQLGDGKPCGVGVFVRRVKIASGATAVQIVRKRGRRVLSTEHIGSAHTDEELAVLLQVAGERRHAGQLALDLGDAGAGGAGTAAVVEGTASLILREVLAGIYDGHGLDRLGDQTFRALVLARVIESASKLDTVRVLTEIGVGSPHRVKFMRCLKRVVERDLPGACSRRPVTGTPPAPRAWRSCSTT